MRRYQTREDHRVRGDEENITGVLTRGGTAGLGILLEKMSPPTPTFMDHRGRRRLLVWLYQRREFWVVMEMNRASLRRNRSGEAGQWGRNPRSERSRSYMFLQKTMSNLPNPESDGFETHRAVTEVLNLFTEAVHTILVASLYQTRHQPHHPKGMRIILIVCKEYSDIVVIEVHPYGNYILKRDSL
jgi:hypothetical protein